MEITNNLSYLSSKNMICDIPNGFKLVVTILKNSLVYGIAIKVQSLRTIDLVFWSLLTQFDGNLMKRLRDFVI